MNEYVQGKVNPPGIAMVILGIAILAISLLAAVWSLVQSVLPLIQASDDVVAALIASAMTLALGMLWPLCTAIGGVLVMLGGLRLRSASSAPLVYAGAIAAMVPCCSYYCCCFGIPLGIWAIVTMQDDQVQAAFAEG